MLSLGKISWGWVIVGPRTEEVKLAGKKKFEVQRQSVALAYAGIATRENEDLHMNRYIRVPKSGVEMQNITKVSRNE